MPPFIKAHRAALFLSNPLCRGNEVICRGRMQNRHSVQWAVRQHAGTGGVVDKEDWRNINWTPISALTGGTSKFKTGLGMKPWYAKGHMDPAGPGEGQRPQESLAMSNDLSSQPDVMLCPLTRTMPRNYLLALPSGGSQAHI